MFTISSKIKEDPKRSPLNFKQRELVPRSKSVIGFIIISVNFSYPAHVALAHFLNAGLKNLRLKLISAGISGFQNFAGACGRGFPIRIKRFSSGIIPRVKVEEF
ncbi:hypothetical protein CDAR_539781 [Caerostris darwini]|uniref:Uncharacterized protein n=1 Tax=Caerostris darwini TaxID=1538125 RepID=A0AAV4MZ54_9ARAC|nr:hypothetical protein CDAR_539781 [Caerostris darwini]